MQPKIFLNYDQAELDRQYDQRAWAANALEVIARYGSASDRARVRLGEPAVLSYGASPAETLDVYLSSQANAPIQVFVHGGAWRLLSKRESAFPAELFVNAGAHFVALDFALLPHTSLLEMVTQVRRAIAWLYRNARTFDGDPNRIYLTAHSSGAHLAANAAVTAWPQDFGIPDDAIKGAVLVSGIYDLKPVRLSARSSYVKLDDDLEHALSPIQHLSHLRCPVVVGYGEFESDEFQRQARDFAEAANRTGFPVHLFQGDGLNHFEVAETLGQPGSALAQLALTQMNLK